MAKYYHFYCANIYLILAKYYTQTAFQKYSILILQINFNSFE